jgi:membrane dipeptidase
MDAELLERARRLHAATAVIDTHADIPSVLVARRLDGETRVVEQQHLPALRAGGFSAIVAACGGDFSRSDDSDLMRRIFEIVDALHREAEESPHAIRIVHTAAELEQARADGVLGMLPSLEGAGALRGSLGVLRDLYRLGIRSLGLTWNFRNELADGAGESRSNGGLTRFGVDVVRELNRLGMLVDVSHLSDAGTRDVLETSEAPVIASHSNARAVCGHIRNLPDWALEGIARSGGVVGIAFFGSFVHAEQPTVERTVDHVDHLKRLIGIRHIAIGPDYTDYMPAWSQRSATRAAGVYSGDVQRAVEGLEDASTLHTFTAALLARNYSEPEAAAILGGNYLRVCRQVLG